MIATILMFDWKDQNGSLDHMVEVQNFGFDSILLKVYFYLGRNTCVNYGFHIFTKKMEHESP